MVFSTKANPTTRENIANVYGVKTLYALIPLDLDLQLVSSAPKSLLQKSVAPQDDSAHRAVRILGHISRPVFGEGRQTPDRQMFFVNSRPCGLPQISKAFNEVYKSYNVTQSPFIFADIRLDPNAYDVNVSPDKRTILLHEQNALLDALKQSLNDLFDSHEQTVPQSTLPAAKLSTFQPLSISRTAPVTTVADPASQASDNSGHVESSVASEQDSSDREGSLNGPRDLISKFATRNVVDRRGDMSHKFQNTAMAKALKPLSSVVAAEQIAGDATSLQTEEDDLSESDGPEATSQAPAGAERHVQDFNAGLASQQLNKTVANQDGATDTHLGARKLSALERTIRATTPETIPSAFDRLKSAALQTSLSVSDSVGKKHRSGSKWTKSPRVKFIKASSFAQRLEAFSSTASPRSADGGDDDSDDGEESSDADDDEGGVEGEDITSENKDDTAQHSPGESDSDYLDEEEEKRKQELQVQELVEQAEAQANIPTKDSAKRATSLLSSTGPKDSTTQLTTVIDISTNGLKQQMRQLQSSKQGAYNKQGSTAATAKTFAAASVSAEEKLSLTISKPDFARMRIAGQFNLGFILATRSSTSSTPKGTASPEDLFIIDQHASDEIYNFHRLSATTILTPQALVRPHQLELTAIEEETIMEHKDTLTRNGFSIAIDTSGGAPVGSRCKLLTLPTSRETVFDLRDLEELLALLGDAGAASTPGSPRDVIRPSRVRKMLAMRACRSSIMVGRTLKQSGMRKVVDHMGEIDRPWNCPHGRPTMRHLAGLTDWSGWREDGGGIDWKVWLDKANSAVQD